MASLQETEFAVKISTQQLSLTNNNNRGNSDKLNGFGNNKIGDSEEKLKVKPKVVFDNSTANEGDNPEKKNPPIFHTGKSESMDSTEVQVVATPKPSRRAYATVAILFFVNLLNYMDRYTVAGVLSNIQHDFDISDAMAGLLQTIFVCSYMVFAPIFGYMGDRHSRKWIMIVGIFIWSAAVLSSTFVPSNLFPVFLILRGVVGIGEASYSTVASTIIADLFSKDMRSRMLMVFYFAIPFGSGLGFIVGSGVASLFTDPNVGWRWGVRVTPLMGVVCLLLLIFLVKEPKRGEIEHASASGTEPSHWVKDLKYLVKNKSFVWTTLGFTCVAFATGSLSWWFPTFAAFAYSMQMKEPDNAQIGFLFGVITCVAGFVGVTVGSMTAQFWRRKNSRADPLVCGIGILLSIPFLYFGLTFVDRSLPACWACVFFAVFCLSLNWAVVSDVLLYIVPPSRRSTASAFQILFSHLFGDATSPYIIGQVSDTLKNGNSSPAANFYSLRTALYIPDFILVIGGFFFLGAAWYVEFDRKNSEMLAKGASINGSSDGMDQSNSYGGLADHIVGEMPSPDSRAYLINPDSEPPDESSIRYRL